MDHIRELFSHNDKWRAKKTNPVSDGKGFAENRYCLDLLIIH
jgi:hypothetical protein